MTIISSLGNNDNSYQDLFLGGSGLSSKTDAIGGSVLFDSNGLYNLDSITQQQTTQPLQNGVSAQNSSYSL